MSVADGMDAKKACSFVPVVTLEASRLLFPSIPTAAAIIHQSYNCPLESVLET
ncbi:hypothetical protein [Natronolimnobius baerhuensis]|uniref:hypothetical protein n=1 Tax=Natronolimnobius baerhuensis TaxID=253108 RepID=UPI001595C325|nr:hypothetical protein [Natronolimnobius baerhuensis]